ncbi:putative serinePthreonine-protein phosphatase 7 long form [Cardamine amara subsp. amara]|uniref:SerinePthreonine-protein phosphatase 7 long form n=1 Tax=Cardamine amara subsp. amara TaxID=228776 RepID=A0ABD1BUL9_CARAN
MEKASSSSPSENKKNLLIEEREEVMVSSDKGHCLRKPHFLKPFVTSIDDDDSVAQIPSGDRRLSVSSSSELKQLSSRICFSGFWVAKHQFICWLGKMEALHAPTWRKAGIYEAIKASTYDINKNPCLILSIAKKWCPETKSFIFPWGEATITLEDVMVLLGFSVLGSSVFAPLETSEMRDSVNNLKKARVENVNAGTSFRVSQRSWISRFLGRGDQMEHEAFLALWLSHFVFPDKYQPSISKKNLAIAVRLARGERIALAIPVLASLYQDLGEISRAESTQRLSLQSLFKLVQVWTWERFKNLRPEAKEIPEGEPRISRWGGVGQRTENVSLSFDDFEWRPYTKPLNNWNPLRFYVEEALWVTVDDNLEDEFVLFARCVRSCKLVGIGFVEDYYPNRVAMQFGLDQDLPGLVAYHGNFTEEGAWNDYNKCLDGLKLYMPSRLATTSVTARYRDWWLKSVSEFRGSSESNETFNLSNTVDDDDNVPPKVIPLSQVVNKLGEGLPAKLRRCTAKNLRHKIRDGNGDGSASTELPLGQLFRKELMKRTSECLKNKRLKLARENDENCNDNISIAQRNESREKIGGDASEKLGKRSRLEEDNNDSRTFQRFAFGDDETVAPLEIEKLSEENDEEEAGSKAEKSNVVLIPSDEKNSSDSSLGAVDIVVSPLETRHGNGNGSASTELPLGQLFRKELMKRTSECLKNKRLKLAREDDELDICGNNTDMIDDGSKEPKCLLQEDGVITRENQRSDEYLCSEAMKEDDDDSLIQKNLALDELALKADKNESNPHQNLASGGANGDETSQAYKSASPFDESNIHIPVEDGSQGKDCLVHDNVLGSEETMKPNEQLENLEKRKVGVGEEDVSNASRERRFQDLKVLALSIEERIDQVERNVAWLKERRGTKQRKIAATSLI